MSAQSSSSSTITMASGCVDSPSWPPLWKHGTDHARSMRDTLKTLNAAFSAPTLPYPLPTELLAALSGFLEKYDEIDDADSQRFHDDLLVLHTKHVAQHPEKLAPFLNLLRAVRPALTGETRLTEWWELVLKPTLDSIGHKRHEIEDAKELLQSVLLFDPDQDKDGTHSRLSAIFLKKTLDIYLARTRIPSTAEAVVSPEDDYISSEIESVLVAFGRRKPKELLLAVDELFVQKQYRTQALILLNAFVRLQTPHLYVVLETQLIQHLETCLLIDTSSAVIGQALVVLIMFLPHITSALTTSHHLARLFLVYSRLLCWDKFGNPDHTTTDSSQEGDAEDSSDDGDAEPAWEQLQHSTDYTDTSPPTLLHYFTFLYGLFPLNFMSFIRKPRKLLKSWNFPGADDFDLDPDLLHSRTEPYRRVHLMHPNLFSTTIEDELAENRWLDSDPADVVVECMDLCVAVSTTLADPGPPPTSKLPDIPIPPIPESSDFALDDGATANDTSSSWRNTQSTMVASSMNGQPDASETFDTPLEAKSIKSTKSASPLLKCGDVIESPTLPATNEAARKPSFLSAPVASPQRLALQPPSMDSFAQVVSASGSPTQSDFQNQSIAALQREIMLLRNDLNFERYLKAQQMAHVGQMQRKHIKEATAEAETQNLINTNKTLKARLAKMNEQYSQLKKETLTRREMSKNWESELTGKVRSFREDQKLRQSEEENLRFELKKIQTDCEHLKKIVEKAETEQLRAQQRTQALEFELEDYGNVRHELEAAQEKILAFETQNKDLGSLMRQHTDLRNELEQANMRLNSRDSERERALKLYERRIMELESRLQLAEKSAGRPGQLPPSVQQMLDSALAANNAKLTNLKKMYHRLQEQKTELEMQLQDLQGENQALIGRLRTHEKTDYHRSEKDALSRNFSVRSSELYDAKYLPPLTSDLSPTQAYDNYSEQMSPSSMNSPSTTTSPARPSRLESLAHQPMHRTHGYGPDFSTPYESSLNAFFDSQSTAGVQSSNKSNYSAETSSSKGEKKDKVAPTSEVRIYGRGN